MAGGRAVLISLTALAFGACMPQREPVAKPAVVPATELLMLDRSPTALAGVIRGRPALVSLWATWCDSCREEIPELKRLDAWAKDRGAVVVGVAVGETLATVSSFTQANQLPYPIVVDEEFRLADALGEKRVPTTLVVDASGRIVFTGGAVDAKATAAFRTLVPPG